MPENKEFSPSQISDRNELCFEWKANYNDGSYLSEYDDLNFESHHFGHIDKDRVKSFELIPTRTNLFKVSVDLSTGLFEVDGKPFTEVYRGEEKILLGKDISGKNVRSSWGNKPKLIFVRHVRRDFVPSDAGFAMEASVIYEIGWEADVDDIHEKYTLLINEEGKLGIPQSFEEQGFKAL